jgi:hypothetical protein
MRHTPPAASEPLGPLFRQSLPKGAIRTMSGFPPVSDRPADIAARQVRANNGSGGTRRNRTCSKSPSRIVRDVLRKMFRVFADAVQK